MREDGGSGALWRRPTLAWLWTGKAVSALGSQITLWALPLAAALTLGASPMQMGALAACASLPSLLAGLLAGVLVDRLPRRPVLIVADVGRAALLVSIPLAAHLGLLSLGQLFVVAAFAGLLTLLFDVAYASLLPDIVAHEDLLHANSLMAGISTAMGIGGPALSGVLVQILGAPLAIMADACSFLVSAYSLLRLRIPVVSRTPATSSPLRREIAEGLHAVLSHPTLRTLALASALFNLFDSILMTVYVLYLTRVLAAAPAAIGIVFGAGGVGGLVGALLAARIAGRLGPGGALMAGMLLAALAELLIALACGSPVLGVTMVSLGEAGVEGGAVLFSIVATSLRQTLAPAPLLGRITATTQVLGVGATPLGALIGGICAEHFGLRAAVLLAGLGTLLALPIVYLSPLRRPAGSSGAATPPLPREGEGAGSQG